MGKALSKRTLVLLIVIIVVLILPGITIYVLKFKPSPIRILVDGEPVDIGSVSLHPEKSKVEATAFWIHEPYPRGFDSEWQIYVVVKLVELDVNRTYHFQTAWFYGEDQNKQPLIGGSSTFGAGIPKSEGDEIHIVFGALSSGLKLKEGNIIDVVLPVLVIKETVVEGHSFWVDTMKVGELKFSVEVQGEPPAELKP